MSSHRSKTLHLGDRTSVGDLAALMDVAPSAVVRLAFEKLGLLAVVTQILTFDQARLIAGEFGFTARRSDP